MQAQASVKQVMRALTLACLAWLTAGVSLAQARQLPTLRQGLQQVLDEADKRCPLTERDLPATNGDARRELLNTKINWAMCDCQLVHIRDALRTVPDAELSRQVDLQKLQAFMLPRALQPCLGEMFRDLFGGQSCQVMQKAKGNSDAAKACACMKPRLVQFSDAEAAELGMTFSEHQNAAAKARKEGKPAPPRTPLMQRMFAVIEGCNG